MNKRYSRIKRWQIGTIAFLFTLAVSAVTVSADLPVLVYGEVSAGYDDNPALIDDGKGSFFATYGVTLERSLSVGKGLNVVPKTAATYQDYEGDNDNVRAEAGGSVDYRWENGTVLSRLLVEGAVYRDRLVVEDERNEAMVGVEVQWIMTSRVSLTLGHSWRWLDFRHAGSPYSGRGAAGISMGMMSVQHMHDGGQMFPELEGISMTREDRLVSVELSGDLYLSSSVTCSASLGYGDLNSSLELEGYRQIWLGVGIVWQPVEAWHVEIEGAWYQTRYEAAPEGIDRMDDTPSVLFGVGRSFGRLEVFARGLWRRNDSPIEIESFRQTVAQCGFSFSF